jgi:hypothetical protein
VLRCRRGGIRENTESAAENPRWVAVVDERSVLRRSRNVANADGARPGEWEAGYIERKERR